MPSPRPPLSRAGYSPKDVAKLLGLSEARVRSFVRAGLLQPRRGPRGEARLSFQDIVLLRTARGLLDARIPTRKLRLALERLRERLPRGRSLAGLNIAAAGDEVVLREGGTLWNAASGQAVFDFDFGFEVNDLARKVAPLTRRAAREARSRPHQVTADDWYEMGCDLEAASHADEARDAYRRALELEPAHADAHINLGRLLHDAGEIDAASAHYRLALAARPQDRTARFNLAVAFEDRGALEDAARLYREVVRLHPDHADAHYNLAGVLERLHDAPGALRHLSAYRRLTVASAR
ncbi:MAG TPA: tetratricopeptide repeat protein [Candidatus Polarisedimenticolaceae bacterium]|nr:tetratricopeptide repeat protein [Candidatus Polarisedimenticolaceae bacterium]